MACEICRSKDRPKDRARHLKYKYGLSETEYLLLLSKQGGKCSICKTGSPIPGFVVDHCHRTDKVRGLLCPKCNLALERLESVEDWALKAEAYLAIVRQL